MIQFQNIQPWIVDILDTMKKEIKTDYLQNNRNFAKTHFGARPITWLTPEELNPVLEKELIKGDESLVDWVINQWVFKNGDLYDHFADRLTAINPQFDEIDSLSPDQSRQILAGAKESFGAINTFLFAFLNGVVFPKSIFDQLEKDAKAEKESSKAEAQEKDIVKLIEKHQREVAKMTEKFDQKIAGILKKYNNDIAALKKQLKS